MIFSEEITKYIIENNLQDAVVYVLANYDFLLQKAIKQRQKQGGPKYNDESGMIVEIHNNRFLLHFIASRITVYEDITISLPNFKCVIDQQENAMYTYDEIYNTI